MFSHLPDSGICTFIFHQHLRMPENHGFHFFQIWLWFFFPSLHPVQNLPENPRIPLCAPTNHDAVAASHLHKLPCSLRRSHISISNDWNLHRFFYLTDNVPVRFSTVILLSGPAMHRYRCCSCAFRNSCNLHCIDMLIVKSFSNLYGYRFFDGFCSFTDDLFHQLRIFHKGRTFAVASYFRHRASHIDIQNGKWTVLYLFRHLTDDIRIGTKQLK